MSCLIVKGYKTNLLAFCIHRGAVYPIDAQPKCHPLKRPLQTQFVQRGKK